MRTTTIKLNEAATIKARARGLLRDVDAALKDKALPKVMRDALNGLRSALTKTWGDLESEAGDEETKEAKASIGVWLESRLHSDFTMRADDIFGSGYITRSERIALSVGIGAALDAFNVEIASAAPQLYQRGLYDEPPAEDEGGPVAQATEAAQMDIEITPLTEASEAAASGRVPIKIITPGWGSSGYYPAEVLKRDGPQVFPKGTHMYWNHATPQEEAQRPEGDLDDLAGVFVSDARWRDDGPTGPGLYSEAKVFSDYEKSVREKGPHIGVSIRTGGRVRRGEAEGRQGPIVEQLIRTPRTSVDFVTLPGAGGQILVESRRNAQGTVAAGNMEVKMNELQEVQEALRKATDENKRLAERLLLREACDFVVETLAQHRDLPALTRNRLIESLSKNPSLKDGALDRDAFKTVIEAAVKEEMDYLAKVAGHGRISGMGSARFDENAGATLESAFKSMGLSESAAKIAAADRG